MITNLLASITITVVTNLVDRFEVTDRGTYVPASCPDGRVGCAVFHAKWEPQLVTNNLVRFYGREVVRTEQAVVQWGTNSYPLPPIVTVIESTVRRQERLPEWKDVKESAQQTQEAPPLSGYLRMPLWSGAAKEVAP